jgi:hypothetical protein
MTATNGDATVPGSCFCGAVRFEVTLPTLVCVHCHCSMCRRVHGAAYVTWFTLPKAQSRVTAGEGELTRHESSDHGVRSFCRRCGSALFFESSHREDQVDIPLANLAAAIDRTPQFHIFFDDRVEWIEVSDSLPRLGGPTGVEPV